jgi:hypothetical protein
MSKDILKDIQASMEALKKPGHTATSKSVVVKTPKKVEHNQKRAEFETYKLWLSIPAQFIGMQEHDLAKLGVTDQRLIELSKIKTNTEFSKKFKVNMTSLTDWGKELKRDPDVLKSYVEIGQSLTKNLIMALYYAALKNGDAERLKAWMTFVEGWSPRETIIQTTTQFDVVGFIREVERQKEAERGLAASKKKNHEQDD